MKREKGSIKRSALAWCLFGLIAASQAQAQSGACCLGNATCVDTNSGGCTTLSGEFMGEGTSCVSTVCTGACCLAGKQCTQGSRDDCTTGAYQGAGSTCESHCAGRLGTGFTYQGQLKENGLPVTDVIDLEASLWTAAIGGDRVGQTLRFDGIGGNPPPIEVINGLFTVDLDFGAEAFNGNTRYLELAVRRPHDPSGQAAFTVLEPRQRIAPTPYALQTRGIHVDASGNVGIGTDAPAANLHVAGDIRSDGPAGVIAHNPANPAAVAILGWFNNVARIRIGGGGDGASNGLDIQKTGDRSLMRIYDSGNAWFRGAIDIGYERVSWSAFGGIGSVLCSKGKRVLGGGCDCDPREALEDSYPLPDGTGWICRCTGLFLRATAICANVVFDESLASQSATRDEEDTPLAEGMPRGEDPVDRETGFSDGRHGTSSNHGEPTSHQVNADADNDSCLTRRAALALLVEALRDLRAEKDAEISALTERLGRLETGLLPTTKGE